MKYGGALSGVPYEIEGGRMICSLTGECSLGTILKDIPKFIVLNRLAAKNNSGLIISFFELSGFIID